MTSIYELVFRFFNDDRKTRLWLSTASPMLGGVSPRDMVLVGRYDRLLRFITQAIEEGRPCGPVEVLDLPVELDEKLPNGERQESIEDAWYREIERRASELDCGTAETIPWESVRARLHARRH